MLYFKTKEKDTCVESDLVQTLCCCLRELLLEENVAPFCGGKRGVSEQALSV